MPVTATSFLPSEPECHHRQTVVRVFCELGVPVEALRRGQTVEWQALEAELDRFVAYGHGLATQRRFMQTPHPHLSGLTPSEELVKPNGIERVRKVVRSTLAAVDSCT